jgi:hypothetical protein
MEQQLTIDDLLNALKNPIKSKKTLPNTKDTWRRIGQKDSFSELGMSSSELESFLSEWISENDYNNIA